MNNSLQNIYEDHHAKRRQEGFSILETTRGKMLAETIGVGKSVLDVGCRDGALTKYFNSGNKVIGTDIDRHALDRARTNLGIETMQMDLNGDWQELSGRRFDVIVAGEVLEHLYYPEHVTEKVSEHLRDMGFFIGSVPNAFSLKNRFRYLFGKKNYTPLSDPTHINQFNYLELRTILEKHFKEVKIIGLGRYATLSRLFPSLVAFDLFFIARK